MEIQPIQFVGLIFPALLLYFATVLLARWQSWAAAFVIALLGIYSWAFLGTILLSLFGILTPISAWIWWSLLLVPIGMNLKWGSKIPSPNRLAFWKKLDSIEWLCLFAIFCSLGGSLLMGIFSAPNNGDVLIYHLPRQLIWISEGSVFPSSMPYDHMHKMPPLTEWIGVQMYLLTGMDRFHFLIQWFALLGCLVLLFGIVESLGGSRNHSLLAAAFFALLPSAFFQASNSKNDLVLAALLLGIFWVALEMWKNRKLVFWRLSLCAYLAALALLAKGTAFAYLPFAALAVGAAVVRNWNPSLLIGIAIGFIVFLGTIAPHYITHFDQIISSESGNQSQHANGNFGIATGTSVFLRNLALQLALPIESWNQSVQKSVEFLALRIGVPTDDPASSFLGAPFDVSYQPDMEDRASGFFQFTIPFAILLGGFTCIGSSTLRNAAIFSAVVFLLSVFLFSLLFRYQLWHSRLMIPAVAAAAPGAGIFLGSIRWKKVTFSIVLLMGLWLLPSLASWSRPLIGRLTVFNMPEDVGVGRAGSGAIFLPLFGKTMAEAGVQSVWLDLQNGVVHAALRYLPLDTKYGFPNSAGQDSNYQAVLTNRPETDLAAPTNELLKTMEFVSEMEGWRLYLAPDLAKNVQKSECLPPVTGIKNLSGLGEWQGPYPQWKINRFALLNPEGAHFDRPENAKFATLQIKKSTGWALDIYSNKDLIGSIPEEASETSIPIDASSPPFDKTIRLIPRHDTPSDVPMRIETLRLFEISK